MGGDAGASAEVLGRSTEVDQVEAAREWLRRQGVDPGQFEDDHRAGPRLSGAAVDDGCGAEDGVEPGRRRPRAGRRDDGRAQGRDRRAATDAGARGATAAAGDGDDPDTEADTVTSRGARTSAGGGRPGSGTVDAEPDGDPEEVARQIVLRKLAVQARTRVELERALMGKAVPEEAAAAVLDRMGEVGLVDDVAFAHDWVASRQQRRHLSRTALRRELQTKGVDRDVIDDALADVEVADEHRAALDLASRRASTIAGLSREVAYRRLGGVLARRGFSASTTARVLAEVLGGWVEDGPAD